MQAQGAIHCHATMNYALGAGEGTAAVEVPIHDAREAALPFDDCGFQLVDHALPQTDSFDPAELSAVHGPMIAELAQALSGCDRTLIYPPIVRSPKMAQKVADYAPITFVHSDFTEDYRYMVEDPARPYAAYIQPLLAQAGLSQRDVALADRVLMLQFWRNLGAERPDHPLAICDARSVPRSDLLPFVVPEYGGLHLEFETFGVRAPEQPADHHWYTYPGMKHDEVLVFRTYDSRCVEQERPFWTPHSAFRDPRAGPDAPARESLEIRILCLFSGH